MKKLLFLFILCISLSQIMKADLGSCIVYEAKFYLKDGSFFNGFIEVAGDGEMSYLDENGLNKYCSDDGMMRLIKDLQGFQNILLSRDGGIQSIHDFDKLTVYKSLQEINLDQLKINKNSNNIENVLGFFDQNDVIFLDSTDVEKIIFWNARYTKRDWIFYELIPAPKNMIKIVDNQQFWNKLSIGCVPETDSLIFTEGFLEWGIELINYNSNVNISELKRLANLKLKTLFDWAKLDSKLKKKYNIELEADNGGIDQGRLLTEYRERHFQELREWFWKRKVLIVQVYGTC